MGKRSTKEIEGLTMFKYNCVINSGNMNIITALVNIGYKSKGNFNMDVSRYLQTDADDGTFEEVDIPKGTFINCESDTNKFLTIAAMRDDNDNNQLVTDGINYAYCPWDKLSEHIEHWEKLFKSKVAPHKCNIDEIENYIKNK